ncbi:MAG: NlpC/P60 family protein [Pseudomonadota bacterium]
MTAVRCSAPEAGARVVAAARGWLGTPYRHQASCRGQGADCLGLIRGIWREVVGPEPETVPAYGPDWAETGPDERLLTAAGRWLRPVAPGADRPGDVLVFRMRTRGLAKHAAVLVDGRAAGPGRLIHAYSGHAVCETALSPAWARRLAGVFRLPGGTI